MNKELYIYSPLYDSTAETVVKQLNEVKDTDNLTIRMNTPGGQVPAGWAIISKLSERKAKTTAIIDGNAASMGAMMLLFVDTVIANDTSSIMFHKAAYPSWYEASEQEQQKLKQINTQFKKKLTAKVEGKEGSLKFLGKVFEADVRNDVELSSEEALSLGIVSEVRELEPKAFGGMQIVALMDEGQEIKAKEKPLKEDVNNNLKIESMDLAKLKAEHPALYAQVLADGKAMGMKEEKDRVDAWAVFNEIDPAKVKEGIESGEPLSAKATAEFSLQAMNGKKIEAITEENADKTDVKKEVKTEAEIQAEADQKALDAELGEIKTY